VDKDKLVSALVAAFDDQVEGPLSGNYISVDGDIIKLDGDFSLSAIAEFLEKECG